MRRRILLADDHPIVRQGLRALLEKEAWTVVAEASDGKEAVALARQHQPDAAVLDLAMPVLNGLDAVKAIGQVSPKTSCIVLSVHDGPQYVLEALRAGAKGYILKSKAAQELYDALRETQAGNLYLSPSLSKVLVEAYLKKIELPEELLSPRERSVLQLIAEGHSTKEIATKLDLTTKTAESYRARIMEKLEIHNTAGLVRYAIRRGIIQP